MKARSYARSEHIWHQIIVRDECVLEMSCYSITFSCDKTIQRKIRSNGDTLYLIYIFNSSNKSIYHECPTFYVV